MVEAARLAKNRKRVILERLAEKGKIVGCDAVTHPVDGTHQGRNEHGADNDRCGIYVQPHRCQKNGKYKNP